jgi:DNA-directed RNA polymerase specialized sigma subunit
MQLLQASLQFHDRYAYAALKGKVSDWLRTKVANEQVAGIGPDLERIGGVRPSFQPAADRKILFEQLKSSLNERDRYILMLLLDDETSPATVAEALGMSYDAAAKAIERVKKRLKKAFAKTQRRGETNPGPVRFCETKG